MCVCLSVYIYVCSYIVEAATIETDISYSKALLFLRFPGIILSTDSVE
jgi:hypothetical protein